MHIVINGWFTGQDAAGSGQYIDHLLAHLLQDFSNHQYTLLTPQGSPHSLLSESLSLPPSFLPENLAKLWWEQITVPLAARRLGADVLFVPYWAAPLWQPVPTVVTIHDLIPILLPAYQGGWLQRLYFRLVSLTARRAAAVITVSHASARDVIVHLKIPKERVVAVHHGPNEGGDARMRGGGEARMRGGGEARRRGSEEAKRRASPSIGGQGGEEVAGWERVRDRYGLPERYFLYLGGFDVRKNVEGVLRSYGRYLEKGGDPAVKLVVAGKLPGADTEFTPDPQRMAADLGLLEDVHFTGWVDDADKPAIYAGAVAYLFPSHYEGFGMMVLEAMAAGTPVVTSATGRQ
jgi:glycosyltransferase involved in cell wall biosynthesis